MCFFGIEWLQDQAGQKLLSTNGAQMFGKNFYIKPEKALKKEGEILDKQEQSQALLFGNCLYSGRLFVGSK